MSTSPADRPDGSPRYATRLKGHLDTRWAAWFDGLTLTNEDDGTTALRGSVVDQAALHGVLQKVRDTGLPLISVIQIGTTSSTAPQPRPTSPGRNAT